MKLTNNSLITNVPQKTAFGRTSVDSHSIQQNFDSKLANSFRTPDAESSKGVLDSIEFLTGAHTEIYSPSPGELILETRERDGGFVQKVSMKKSNNPEKLNIDNYDSSGEVRSSGTCYNSPVDIFNMAVEKGLQLIDRRISKAVNILKPSKD